MIYYCVKNDGSVYELGACLASDSYHANHRILGLYANSDEALLAAKDRGFSNARVCSACYRPSLHGERKLK